jgi:hypothetical protein
MRISNSVLHFDTPGIYRGAADMVPLQTQHITHFTAISPVTLQISCVCNLPGAVRCCKSRYNYCKMSSLSSIWLNVKQKLQSMDRTLLPSDKHCYFIFSESSVPVSEQRLSTGLVIDFLWGPKSLQANADIIF